MGWALFDLLRNFGFFWDGVCFAETFWLVLGDGMGIVFLIEKFWVFFSYGGICLVNRDILSFWEVGWKLFG